MEIYISTKANVKGITARDFFSSPMFKTEENKAMKSKVLSQGHSLSIRARMEARQSGFSVYALSHHTALPWLWELPSEESIFQLTQNNTLYPKKFPLLFGT